MGIRETISGLPSAGTVKTIEIKGLGPVRFKRLSMKDILAMPNEQTASHGILASALDENDAPLFANIESVLALQAAIAIALVTAYNQVNTIDVETALKN